MRKLFVSTILVLATGLAFSGAVSSAGIVDAPKPLIVKIKTFDGKKRVKVARTLKIALSCSKDCSVVATFAVRTPAGVIKNSSSGAFAGNQLISLKVRLNRIARAYLKRNYRKSRFTIRVSAKDLETGKRVITKRSFRFYR